MTGQLIKRGESWTVRIFLGRDASGKRKYFNKTIHGTKKDAQKYLTAKLREKDLGVFIEPASMVFKEYFKKWLNESAKPRLAESTFESYRSVSTLYISDEFNNSKLSDIRPFDVQKIYNSMIESGLTARTVRYLHAILTSAFSQAIKWQMLIVNPCNAVNLPKLKKTEMKAFTPNEARQFLEAAKNDKHGLIFSFALTSGMRPSEYLALKWTDIDLVKHTATVQRVISWRKGGGWYFAEPKTAKSRRTLPIPQHISAELKKHKVAQAKAMLKRGESYERNNFVFKIESVFTRS